MFFGSGQVERLWGSTLIVVFETRRLLVQRRTREVSWRGITAVDRARGARSSKEFGDASAALGTSELPCH